MMLIHNRVDIVLSGSRQGKGLIKARSYDKHVFELKQLKEDTIYAYIHKKHANLAEKIALTLDKMKNDGSFKTIHDKALSEFNSR